MQLNISNSAFSVLISTYINDNPLYFEKALLSICNQSLIPNQIVIVIDGEITEENETVISKFKNQFIEIVTLVKLPVNLGLGNALNEGLKHCKYNLVARMDADDECFFERFETQTKYFETNPNISVLGSYMQKFCFSPNDLNDIKKRPIQYKKIKAYSKFCCPLNHPTVMFNKAHIQAVGGYKMIKGVNIFEDHYLWLRLLNENYLIGNIPECLVHYNSNRNKPIKYYGLGFLKKEFIFFTTCYKEKLIPLSSYLFVLFTRLPLRILPKKILQLSYKIVK